MLSIDRAIEFAQRSCKRYALILIVGLAIVAGMQQESQAQITVNAGGFRIQFWSQGDNGASGANVLNRVIADTDLGTWTAAERAAVIRSAEYWTNRLNLPAAGGNSPIIRAVKDEAPTGFNANALSVLTTTAGVTTTNTANRLVNAANPARTDGIDGRLVFFPGRTAGVVNTWGTNRSQQIGTEAMPLEAVSMHEFGHLLGFTSSHTPFASRIIAGNVFGGATAPNAVNVYGGTGVPLELGPFPGHVLINYHNITRANPFGIGFRNILAAAPAELAILADLGYGIALGNEFGRVDYQNAVLPNEVNAIGFNSVADYGIGYFLQGDNYNVTQTADLFANGFAGTGIRLSDAVNNTITIDAAAEVRALGEQGIGVLVGAGSNNIFANRGVVNASGINGRGFVFDFGVNLLDPATQITSADYNAPLVDRLDITGIILASTNAIHIGSSAAVGDINVMDGADITGNIFSDALVGGIFTTPTLTFGKTADANGFATVAPDAGFNYTYAGNISGTLPKAVLDIETFGGTTTLNGLINVEDVLVRTTSTLNSNNTFLATNLRVNNLGILNLNAGYTQNGGTTQVDNGGLLTALDFTMNSTIPGTTTIDAGGVMTVTNQIDVQGGVFRVNGIATSNSFLIGGLGTLMGAGTVMSNVTQNGTIAPGNSIGTLTITGNHTSSSTAIYTIEAQASAAPVPGVDVDLIAVGGTSVVDGGTVNVLGTPGAYTQGTFYRFLQAAGGLTVTQTPFYTDDIAGFRAVPFFNANELGFLVLPDLNYLTIGRTFNQRSFGNYFNAVHMNPNPNIQSIRNQIDLLPNTNAILGAIDQLTGDIYASLSSVGTQNTNNAFSMLSHQQAIASDVTFAPTDGRNSPFNDGWISGFGLDSEVSYDGNAAALGYNTGGTHFGVANHLDDNSRIGFFGSYGQTSVNTSTTTSQTARADNMLLGGFIYSRNGNAFTHFAGAFGFDEYKASRRINFGAINEIAKGDFTGNQAAFMLEQGFDFRWRNMQLQPIGSMRYIHYRQGAFTETNGNETNLSVERLDTNSFRTSLGTNLSNELPFGSRFAFISRIHASWEHEYLNAPYEIGSAFAADTSGTNFTVRGLDFGTDWIDLGAGISIAEGNNFVIRLDYSTQFNSHMNSHSGTGSITMLW